MYLENTIIISVICFFWGFFVVVVVFGSGAGCQRLNLTVLFNLNINSMCAYKAKVKIRKISFYNSTSTEIK